MNLRFTLFKRSRWILALMSMSAGVSQAQVSVTATAGTPGPTTYTALNAAFAAINAGTHQGAISIAITANTSEPATPTPLLASGGTSAYTSISIMPSGGSFTISSAAAPVANRGIIELAGADNVTIDGDDPATAGTQNLSIVSSVVATGGIACIRISSNSTTGLDGANNNTVKNCIITGARIQATTNNSRLASYGIQFSNGVAASSASTGAYANINTTIQNNTISRCFYGIHAIGNVDTYLNTGLKVISNKIGGATTNENVAAGININYTSSSPGATSALISGNDLQVGFGTSNVSLAAITVDAVNAGAVVTRNNIHDCVNPSSGVWGMYGIQISSGTSNTGITITNNMIRDISGYPVSSLGNVYGGSGIYVSAAATGIICNHNSIAQLGSSVIGNCILMGDASATFSQFINNILVNNVASSYSCLFYVAGAGNISGATMNNNNYFINASGVFAYYGANITSFAAWKTATLKDANGQNLLPAFLSATNLHLTPGQISFLESAGAPVATTGVSVDYDNDARPGPAGSVNGGGIAPDIGADEFDGILPPSQPTITAVAASPSAQCAAVAHNITATVTPGGLNLSSVVLTYYFNGVAQPTVGMTGGSVSANSVWNATIPAATPVNANVSWMVTVTDGTYTKTTNGVTYKDALFSGITATAVASPSTICAGSSATLSVNVPISTVFGAGALTTANSGASGGSSISPFSHYYGGGRFQYMYTASELTAMGMSAGNLTSLSLDVTAAGTTYNGFAINVTQTVTADLSGGFITTGLTPVYAGNVTPVVGINTYNFSTPFSWDGTSNVVFQICWSNSNTGGTAAEVKYDNTSFVSEYYSRVDNAAAGATCAGIANFGSVAARPKMIINLAKSSGYSYSWSDGVTTIGTSTTGLAVTPAVNTTYSATITDPATTCTLTSSAVTVTVNPLPATPTAVNSTQCGLGVPTASVSGGTTYRWYATNTSTTVLQSGTSTNYTTSINATSTWYVSSYNGTCESLRIPVTTTVTVPDMVTATSSSSLICPGQSFTLTATRTGTNNNAYSYTWTATPAAGSGIATSVTGTTTVVTPVTTGSYQYLVIATDGVCTTTASVNASLNNLPVINASANPTVVCSGSNVNLNATTNTVGNGTVAIGTGNSVTGNTDLLTAFCNRYSSYKMQAVYTAAELNAAGLRAGNITSVTYSISTIGSAANTTVYSVKLGATAAAVLTDYVPSGTFTAVYNAATQNHAVGMNTITFTTPYNWDGVSNVIVEVSHNGINSSNNANSYYSTTAGNQQVYGINGAATGTPTNQRLNVIFGGQAVIQGAGSYTWQWNPGAINTNTAVVTPVNTSSTVASTSSYTITGIDPATTCSNTAVVTITVNPVPAIPTVVNSVQCGVGTATASVSGGSTYKWYAAPTSTTVLQSGPSVTYTTSIGSTTTWYVSSYNATCESGRVAVTATVTIPDAVTATSTNTSVCPGQSFTLTAARTGTNNNAYSYTWTATPAAGSGIATSVTGATTVVSPVTPGSYSYMVTASDGVCTAVASANVMLTAPPSITASGTPNPSCSGSTVTLNATIGTIASGTVAIGVTSMTLASGDYLLGANPYNHWYGGQKDQYIFTSSELAAAGLTAGNITALSFDVVSATSLTMANFAMTVGHTTQSAATATAITTGLTPVYSNASQGVTAGLNNYVFSTPFNWNGTDNIVVSLSWSNVNGGSTALTASVRAHTASFVATTFLYADNTSAASLAAASFSTSAGIGSTSRIEATNIRPNIVFAGQRLTQGAGGITWQWNPGAVNSNTMNVTPVTPGPSPINPSYTVTAIDPATTCSNTAVVTLTVNPVPTVTVAASTSTLCSGTSASLTATGATTYAWLPAGGTSSVAVVSPAATTVYTVTGTALGCSNTQTVSLGVTATPTVAASVSPTVICAGATVSLTATGATTYNWMPNSSTSGTTTAAPTVSTIYTVSGTSAGCTNTRTVSVTVNDVPTLTVTANPAGGALCTAGATATLTAAGTSTSYTWSTGANTANITVAPSATTVYTVAGLNSCGTATASTTVAVATTPTIAATTSSTLICINNSVVLTANATPGATYSWNTGASTSTISVTPTVTTTYTVTGTNACGTATATIVQNVSTCIGINEITNFGDINIYPNPASDYVSIAIPAYLTSESTIVEVTDALGKLVMKEALSHDVTTFKITKLEEGVYFFKVITNNQTIKVGKVVKH